MFNDLIHIFFLVQKLIFSLNCLSEQSSWCLWWQTKLYRENNEQGVKLTKLKFSVKTSQRRASDNAYDEEFKRKEADRKRKFRAKKASKVYTITIARNQSTFTFITNACLVIPGHLTKLVFVIWGEDIFLEILWSLKTNRTVNGYWECLEAKNIILRALVLKIVLLSFRDKFPIMRWPGCIWFDIHDIFLISDT